MNASSIPQGCNPEIRIPHLSHNKTTRKIALKVDAPYIVLLVEAFSSTLLENTVIKKQLKRIMSLPSPTIGGASNLNMDPQQLQAMEGPLIALANSAGGDLRKLMFAFFSFLHRRTDFYLVPNDEDLNEGKAKMGFKEGEAEKLLLAAFRQFPLRRMPRQQSAPTSKSSNSNTSAPSKASPSPAASEKKPAKEVAKVEGEKATPPLAKSKETSKKEEDPAEKVRYTEEGVQVPVGNGGTTSRYKWTQTLEECTVMLGVPAGTRAKELDVSIKASSLHVKTKNKTDDTGDVTTFVEGPLVEKIQPDESTWSIEGGVIIIILQKMKKTFWATVIEGDEKIDTDLVDSRRHISDYDEATQGQLRRIMFDQKQQEKGLPTSDDLLGTKTLPTMPPGVEYIDKTTFEKEDKK